MLQKDGNYKGVRCTVILTSAFEEETYASLRAGELKSLWFRA